MTQRKMCLTCRHLEPSSAKWAFPSCDINDPHYPYGALCENYEREPGSDDDISRR